MKRSITAVAALALLLTLPAGAAAKPSQTDRVNASQECRAERGDSPATHEAFRDRHGTNKSKRNAFGKCVSKTAKAQQDDDA